MKRESPTRLRSELWNTLRPEIDLNVLVKEIKELLQKFIGESARNETLAHNLASCLTQKYSIGHRKPGRLWELIELYPEDLAVFLEGISYKEYRRFAENVNQLSQTKKKPRVRPQTKAEIVRRRQESKNRYEWRRRQYREGLIIEQFGTLPAWFDPRNPLLSAPPEGPCLDVLFRGGAIKMAGDIDSLENLFGEDRHRFPKSLRHERSKRTKVYHLNAFLECLIHLLTNKDGHKQWLPQPTQRELVLRGIIERAHRCSPEIGDLVEEELRPYLS